MRLVCLLFLACIFGGNINAQQAVIQVSSAINGTTTSTCNGFIIDSGGQGGTGYSDNENVVFTICPDVPGDIITVQFNLFDLDVTNTGTSQNPNMDEMFVYDGTSTSATFLGNYTGNQLQGVVIQCTPQNLTGCLTFRFRSNTVGTGQFSGIAMCSTPCADPSAGGVVLNGISNDSIHACIGETISFQELGSSAQNGFTIADYTWDFMDGTTVSGQNVSHSYDAPGHYRVQLFVTDNNGCTNNNLIDIDVLIATLPNFVDFQGDTTLCVGESLTITADPHLYENTWTGFSGFTEINDGCLLDTQLGVAQNIDIVQTGFAAGTTITDITQIQSLCLDMEHSFMGDLVISISCPNGQNIIMHQQGGGGTQIGEPNQNDNVDCTDPSTQGVPYNYCFTPSATTTWVEYADQFGGTLPAGDYESVQSFQGLVGCPTNGVWTLTVVDNWAADDGVVFSFALTLDPSLYPDVVQFTPQHGTDQDSSYWTTPAPFVSFLSSNADQITITPTAAGTYNYVYNVLNSFGCLNDTSFNVVVTDFNIPFNLVDTTVCAGNIVRLINDSNLPSCTYTILLHDSFGDGWNGNSLKVNNNGVLQTYTINGGLEGVFNIVVEHGSTLQFNFDNTGSFDEECSYEILDCLGATVFSDGGNWTAPTPTLHFLPVNFFSAYTLELDPDYLNQTFNVLDLELFIENDISVTANIYPIGHPLCAESATMNITILPNSYIGMDSTVSICQTTMPVDLFQYLGPGANPNGTWEDPSGSPIVMPLDPITMLEGDYVYTVSASGCTGFATITVNKFSPTITGILINDATCVNAANGSAVITGTNFSTYSVNGGQILPAQSPFTVPNLGEGTYLLTIYGSPGCMLNQSFTVDDPDSLAITFITPTVTICPGDSAQLTVTASGGSSAYIYSWTLNGQFVSNAQTITVTPTVAYNPYCVTLTEACGSTTVVNCTAVQFEQPIIPTLVSPDPNVCIGDELIFNDVSFNPNIAQTFISFGDGDSLINSGLQTFTHTYDSVGTYSLGMMVISVNGCVYSNYFSNLVSVHENPVADFTINPNVLTIFNASGTLINQSSLDANTFQWYMPGSYNDTATTEDAFVSYPVGVVGEYLVSLVVHNYVGCMDSTSQIILVQDELLLFAPNSFTPNADELNNTWKIVVSGIDFNQFNMKIYDRWGELIFESSNPEIGWDGTYQNHEVQTGIYQWTMEGVNILTNERFERHGFVNIFR